MQRTVMVFGAGINQLTLIEAVNDLGHRSLVIDPSPNPPGKAKADIFIQIAKDDYDATKEAAIKYNVSGIVTGQMENPLKLMARLAQELGYIFHSPEVIERSTNKFLMKQAFLEHGIPCAGGRLIHDSKILSREELDGFVYPVIIKPLSAFSSRGVYKIDSYQDYLDKIESTLSFSDDGDYLIEDFIEGQEYSVETITYQGDTTIIQYTEKIITPYPNTVEIGHIQPANLSETQKSEISEVVIKAIKSLDIDNSAAHTELKMTSKGPVIIEIGPRLGGDFISSYLSSASTGISMDMAAIQISIGNKPELEITKHAASVIKFICLPPGRKVTTIKPIICDNKDHILMQHITVKTGDVIPVLTDSSQRSGWVIAQAETRKEAEAICCAALNHIKSCIILS